jgi:hypothetical protein
MLIIENILLSMIMTEGVEISLIHQQLRNGTISVFPEPRNHKIGDSYY